MGAFSLPFMTTLSLVGSTYELVFNRKGGLDLGRPSKDTEHTGNVGKTCQECESKSLGRVKWNMATCSKNLDY